MDHYFLCICKGKFSAEENDIILDSINSLLPSADYYNYNLTTSSHLAPLLRPAMTFITVLNCCQEQGETIIWNEVSKDNPISSFLSASQEETTVNFEDLEVDSCMLSMFFSSLADQLPLQGSYKLGVFLSCEVLKNSSVSEHLELASSFYRLLRWHGMYAAVLSPGEHESEILKEWCEIMDADVLQLKTNQDLGSSLWKGSLQLQVSNMPEKVCCRGLELRLDLLENEENLFLTGASTHSDSDNQFSKKHVVLSSMLHAVDECRFSSIPPYMKLPSPFRLCISKSNILNENSLNLVKYLSSKKEAALIVKMDFSLLHEKPKPEKLLCTTEWKKAVTSGCISCPEPALPTFDNHAVFAVTISNKSSNIIAYPLREPIRLKTNFYNNIVDSLNSNALKLCDAETRKVNYIESLMKQPRINSSMFAYFLKKFKNLRKYQSSNNKKDNLIYDIHSHFNISSLIELANKNSLNFDSRTTLMSDFHSVFSSEDIRKHFESSGRPKNLANTEVISLQKDRKEKSDFNAVLKENWPNILNALYDDIYYNSNNQAEEKESIGNQMVQLYVQHETASTCNNQQLIVKSSVALPRKDILVSEKKFKIPSFRQKQTLKTNYKMEKNTSFENKISIADVSKKSLVSNSRANSSSIKNSGRLLHEIKSHKQSNKKKFPNNVPVRSSPRKKIFADSKSPSVLRYNRKDKHSSIKKTSSVKANELPELQKKKLRVAVASALESHGINLGDEFFKPCGKRLFAICQAFVQDISQRKGSTSQHMKKIADAHVKQVIEFEKQKET